jgi:hypothetical protein
MKLKSLFISSTASRVPKLAKALVLGAFTLGAAAGSTACLDRPIGTEQPRTTNVIVDQLVQSAVDKIDLLFVIDNSISMADKQAILALALPDLVGRLVSPICVNADGDLVEAPETADTDCPRGSAREFNPIDDIHIAVITSSLGGYGAVADCVDSGAESAEQTVDLAHLLGSLPRGGAAAPSAAGTGFLSWVEGSQRGPFVTEFADLVRTSGEFGCGWEATLEAWYRFLVEPYPYTQVVRQPCNASDANNLCAGPETDGVGNLLVDQTILNQRAAFLRPDSLLAIVMLSDENDCSFRASGQTWRLSQTVNADNMFNPAFKGTDACNDPAFGPNDQCCHSCGQASAPPAGCPTATNADGATVGVGCEVSRRYGADGLDDHPNLRCYEQKRRFGVDYLYPVERYTNALDLSRICPFSETLDPEDAVACPGQVGVVPNPLFQDLGYNPMDPDDVEALPRPKNLVFLAGIVGVPWQDVAVSADADDELVYRVNRGDAPPEELINWDWLIGERFPVDGIPAPLDPLMVESVTPRSGMNPATMEPVADPGSGFLANSINGHEWNINDNSDLQYACIFPLATDQVCITQEEFRNRRDLGEAVPNCDCTDFGGEEFQNPLCQTQNGQYGATQTYAKAYPSLRQLQVLHDYGTNSIVASICPKETSDQGARDFGYRPAVGAIVDRLKEQLADKCLNRELSVRDATDANGMEYKEAACIIVEATPKAGEAHDCSDQARGPVVQEVQAVVRQQLEDTFQCDSPAECATFQLCEITQLTRSVDEAGYESCLNSEISAGNGWCYVDPAKGLGSQELVSKCPSTAQRKLRFIGAGTPEGGTVTFVACAGAAFTE